MTLGEVECRQCGTANRVHPFDVFPRRGGWHRSCNHCGTGLPWLPAAAAFFIGLASGMYAGRAVFAVGENWFGTPMPSFAFLAALALSVAAGAAVCMLLTALYCRLLR